MKNRPYIIAFAVLLLILAGQSWYYNNRLNKQYDYFEKEVQTVKDSIAAIDIQELKIIASGKNETQKAVTKKNNINKKLQEDEKAIDNTPVSNDEFIDFLARHGENND